VILNLNIASSAAQTNIYLITSAIRLARWVITQIQILGHVIFAIQDANLALQ
jgi:hypothetical protein